jgi:hypothetical protein
MEQPKWLYNSRIVGTSAFRLYHYLLWVQRVKPHPVKGSAFIAFDRRHLAMSLGFSYNSLQDGIRELEVLGVIQLDPERKGNKNLLLLNTVEQFNKEEVKKRLSSSLLNFIKPSDNTSKSDEES